MSAGKRTPGPRATGLVNLTPIEAMRQDRKKLVAKMKTLTSERDALREACRALIANVDKGDTQLTWSWEYITANNLQDGTSNIDAMRAALSLSDGAE